MKTKLTKRFSSLIAILAFLALLAGIAFAETNNKSVVSPYWQSDSGSYTFIAVSHTSLSGMASQIGLTMTALGSDQVNFGTALTFTIDSGTTTRVFIVGTNHDTFNPTSIPSAQFIQGTTNFTHGSVLITPVASNPEQVSFPHAEPFPGYRDTTMLSYWGSVVIEQNTTGFAMEFIGDMNDSQGGQAFAGNGINQIVGPSAP